MNIEPGLPLCQANVLPTTLPAPLYNAPHMLHVNHSHLYVSILPVMSCQTNTSNLKYMRYIQKNTLHPIVMLWITFWLLLLLVVVVAADANKSNHIHLRVEKPHSDFLLSCGLNPGASCSLVSYVIADVAIEIFQLPLTQGYTGFFGKFRSHIKSNEYFWGIPINVSG